MSHTKTPWTAEWSQWPSNGGKGDSLDIYGKDGSCIATLRNANKDANAAFMIQAVNSHQAMKEALEEFILDIDAVGKARVSMEWPDLIVTYNKAKKALTLANGGQP